MTITKGQIVYSGGKPGRVIRKIGPHAVKVVTAFERPEQDFASLKITVVRGYREETWPVKMVNLNP